MNPTALLTINLSAASHHNEAARAEAPGNPCFVCDGKGYEDNPQKGLSPLYCFACEGTGDGDRIEWRTTTVRHADGTVTEWEDPY